jgi:autotransporter adhesin
MTAKERESSGFSAKAILHSGAALAALLAGIQSGNAIAANTIIGQTPVICAGADDNLIVANSGAPNEVGCETDTTVVVGLGNIVGDAADDTVVIGRSNEVSNLAPAAVAIGRVAKVTGQSGVAIGNVATAGDDGIALGRGSDAFGRFSIALGVSAKSELDAVAIGRVAEATGRDSISIGVGTNATQSGSIAIGTVAQSTGSQSVAIGTGSNDGGISNVVAVGSAAGTKRKIINMASGAINSASTEAITGAQLFATNTSVASALGAGSIVNGTTGAITGPNFTVVGGAFNNVGAALDAIDTEISKTIIYDNIGKTAATLGGIGATSSVSLRNLAAGTLAANSSEAVNGSQLFATNQKVTTNSNQIAAAIAGLGAGAAINGTTGAVTAPAFNVVGSTFNNVGSALGAIDTQVAKAIIYDNAGHTAATLGGSGALVPVALRNLGAGSLSATSTDAVNGAQLFATNQKVDTNSNNIATTLAAIGGGGAINPSTGALTAPSFNILGSAFGNVGEALAALDNELSGAVFYDDKARSRATLGGVGVTTPVSLQNVGAGALDATSTEAVNGSQLFVTNENLDVLGGRMDDAESGLSNLNKGIANATIGIVQQEGGVSAGGVIRIGAASGGSSLSLLGTDGVRVLSGLGAARLAVDSDEAVTGAQLFATNQLILGNTTAINEAVSDIGDNVNNITNLTNAVQNGTIGLVQQDLANLDISVGADVGGTLINIAGTDGNRLLTGLSAGTLDVNSTDAVNGSQLFATNEIVDANTQAIDDIQSSLDGSITNITNLTNAIQNGTIGLVQQDLATRNLSVGSATDGLVVDFAGTGGNRQLTGVAAGSVARNSSDAVNGAQLFATDETANNALRSAAAAASGVGGAALALGGGARFDPANGSFTAPTYAVAGGTFNDVGSALLALDDDISNVSIAASNSVQYDNPERSAVTLGGQGSAAPVSLRNVQAGALSNSSTEAVNGSQLFATNQAVAANTTAITNIDRRVTNLEGSVNGSNQAVQNLTTAIQNGTIGLVQQDPATQDINVASATGGTVVNVAGTAGSRTLKGVKAGAISASSTEAVNGSQLFALQQSIDSDLSKVDNRINGLDSRVGAIELDLRELRGEMNSAVASAIAIGMLPNSTNPGRFTLGMGTGVRAGQMATAFGLSYRTTDDMFTMQARAAFDKEAVSVGVGMGLEF